jgi:uncharacterized membrane protein
MKAANWKKEFLVYILGLQSAVVLAIVFDIPFVRQVLVSLYLFLVPGFITVKALKIETSNMSERVLYSVGLSIVIIMLIGLMINSLSFIPKPLSAGPLLIATSIFVLALSVLIYSKERKDFSFSFSSFETFNVRTLVLYLALPLLSAIGLLFVKAFDNNLLILFTIEIISFLFVILFSKLSVSHYPFALVSITSALLLMTFLSSNYLNGYDVHFENVVFTATKNMSYWNPSYGIDLGRLWSPFYVSNSMLASTVLPTFVSNMANMDGILIFSVVFPLIFSLVPLALYQLYRTQWGKKVAFLAVLFFISNAVFFEFRNNTRQMIAELFFILIFLVLFKKNLNGVNKWILLTCFGFALIVSYYTLTYVFLFLIISTWLLSKTFGKHRRKKISSSVVAFFPVCTFLWYLYISAGPFARLNLFLYENLQYIGQEFFNYQARGSQVLAATNVISAPTFFHQVGRIVFYVSVLFILIGFFMLIAKRFKERIDSEFSTLIILSMIVLSLSVVLPYFAYDFQMGKLYHVALLFLSPLFIIGGKTFFENILRLSSLRKKKRESWSLILVSIVLVSFFLFQTGFIYEVTEDSDPTSIALSGYRMNDLERLQYNLINEHDLFGAMWLLKYASLKNGTIYSDVYATSNVLISTLIASDANIQILSNETARIESPSYVFLDNYNTKNGVMLYALDYPKNVTLKINELPVFNSTNFQIDKVYANGACELYYHGVL